VVIVAHSLGCIAAVHLPASRAARARGLAGRTGRSRARAVLHDFAPVPCERLPYRSIVVASSNDPYCPARLAGAYARAWGSEFLRLPDAGHINVESGHGAWPLGFALLQSLLASNVSRSRRCTHEVTPAYASKFLFVHFRQRPRHNATHEFCFHLPANAPARAM
jgi:predicted alpha/beta hydrolase family esterase